MHRQVEQVGLGVDLMLEKCHYDVAPIAGREGRVRRRKRGSRRMRACLCGGGGGLHVEVRDGQHFSPTKTVANEPFEFVFKVPLLKVLNELRVQGYGAVRVRWRQQF